MAEKAPDLTRWQGFTHKELYRLLHEGGGPAASANPSRRWAELASTLSEVGQDLRKAIDRSGSVWSGQAAGNAYTSLRGLVDWATQTATGATRMRQSVENQADFLARARAEMPVPDDVTPAAPDPTGGAMTQVLAVQRDKEPVEASASTGAQKAFEVMATYQRSTNTNTSGMAAFNAPAELIGGPELTRHNRGGVTVSTPVVTVQVGDPAPAQRPPEQHPHHPHHPDHPRRDWDATHGAGFEGDLARPRPMPGPGSFTVAAPRGDLFFGATLGLGLPLDLDGSGSGRSGGGRTSMPTGGMPTSGVSGGGPSAIGSGAPGSGGPGSGGPGSGVPGSGVPGSGVPGSGGHPSGPGIGSAPGVGPHSADIPSAAAGQAAAAAGTPAAATPGAAAGTGASSAGADRGPLRRLGVEGTIGSGQWFGDTLDSEVRGAAPNRRRRDLTQQPVTESVSIDGEQHQLPHNVIGEGPN